jgi:hypothetical protein
MGISRNSIPFPGLQDMFILPQACQKVRRAPFNFNLHFLTTQETLEADPHMAGKISSRSQLGISRILIWLLGLRDIIN